MKAKFKVMKILFIFTILLAPLVESQSIIGKMRILGNIEQGTVNIDDTSSDIKLLSEYKSKKIIKFNQTFMKIPQILLTITSIQRLKGQSNSFASFISSTTVDAFEITFDNFFENSSFQVKFAYLAFENDKFVQVHHFIAASTQMLSNKESQALQVQSERIGMIPFTGTSGKQIQSTAYFLGAKTTFTQQIDLAVSASTQLNKEDNFIEVIASTWNQVKIEKVWISVLTWSNSNSYQGDWKNYLEESDEDNFLNYPWTNRSSTNRFSTLSMPIKISQDMSEYTSAFGIRGFDVREGPLAVIVKKVTYDIKNLKAMAEIGTIGDALLIGVQINTIILGDNISTSRSQEDDIDPIIITAAIASILVMVFIAFSVIYLKYFASPDPFDHQMLDDSPTKLPIAKGNTSPTKQNEIITDSPPKLSPHFDLKKLLKHTPTLEDDSSKVVTLEFPEKLDLKDQIGKQLLFSKDLLTGIKFTEKFNRVEIKDPVIVEETNEASTKSQSKGFTFEGNKEEDNEKNRNLNDLTDEVQDDLKEIKEFPEGELLSLNKQLSQDLELKSKPSNQFTTSEITTLNELNQ